MTRTPPATPPTVRAEGVVLRALLPSDAEAVAAAFEDPAIQEWNTRPRGMDVPTWMAFRNDWSDGDHASWAVTLDDDDVLAGTVSLHHIDVDQADAEVGYWVAPWARRRGVATSSVRAALAFAFTTLQLHRVYLFHAVENAPSCRVAAAAGFRQEGELRRSYRYADGEYHDEHLHAIVVDEWAAAQR
jgi:RimJ/RimL family protein N-acetyltransferase